MSAQSQYILFQFNYVKVPVCVSLVLNRLNRSTQSRLIPELSAKHSVRKIKNRVKKTLCYHLFFPKISPSNTAIFSQCFTSLADSILEQRRSSIVLFQSCTQKLISISISFLPPIFLFYLCIHHFPFTFPARLMII